MAPIHLIASSDDFLLEEQVREITRASSEALGGIEPEALPSDVTPEDLATELCSPSLFAPQRLFVVADLGTWVEAPPKASSKKNAEAERVDVTPLIRVLEEGLSPDITVVIGALCRSKPKGPLISAVDAAGEFEWLAAPETPKPWEDVDLSTDQERFLRGVLARAAGDVKFTEGAQDLLLQRLGYAPRLLVQETRKLVAAHVDKTVDEALVTALCFPKERSLEAVRDAVFAKQAAPVLDLLAAVEAGIPVRDWRGQLVKREGVPIMIASQVGSMFQQMLYLRRFTARVGMEQEITNERTSQSKWYPYQFKNGFGPTLLEHLKDDAPSPIAGPGKKPPTLFSLGQLFKGASRWSDHDLVNALAGFGDMESGLRGGMPTEALSVWLARALGDSRQPGP